MRQVERTRTMSAAPGEVWRVLSDFAGISAWAPNVEHSCMLSSGSPGVGARRRVQVGRTALVETVQEWQPPDRLAYCVEGLPRVVRSLVNTWEVVPVAGGVVVTLTSSVDAGPRPLQQIIARIVGARLASASSAMLAGLDAHISVSEVHR